MDILPCDDMQEADAVAFADSVFFWGDEIDPPQVE
jgi:hypothetical protein